MFLIFNFWSWIFDKSSKFWAASCKKESNLLLVRFTVCIEPCFPIGWRTEKILQSAALFRFGLRNDEFFTCKPKPKAQLLPLPHLWNTVWWKKITAWAYANRKPNKQEDWVQFCMKWLRTLTFFKIFTSENKKLKTYSGWCPFQGLFNDTTLI